MHHARRNPLGRILAAGLLVTLLGAVSMAFVQCTMIDDTVTGAGLSRSSGTSCIKRCNDQYAELYKLEQKRHRASVEVCHQIEDSQLRNDCLQGEAATHEANKSDLTTGKLACQAQCHRQGTGSAGSLGTTKRKDAPTR